MAAAMISAASRARCLGDINSGSVCSTVISVASKVVRPSRRICTQGGRGIPFQRASDRESEISRRFFWATLIALAAWSAGAETITGRVVGVADGDTVTVLDADRTQHKIRVAGIDAPEKKQAFGQRSKASMSDLVFGKDVVVMTSKRDRYGRLVGKVLVAAPSCTASTCPKTLDAGLAQITTGMAWWYRQYAQEQSAEDAGAYEFAEQEARGRHAGLWRDADPIAPWDWRRASRP
jgi:endonuclease YncB( thermonuclease family)